MKMASALLASCVLVFGTAHSSENGNPPGAAPFGVDGQSYFDLPPSGIFFMNYTGYVESSKLVDDNGHNALPGARLKTLYNTARLSFFPNTGVWGSDWQAFEIFPTLVRSEFSYGGHTESKTGLADLAIDPFGLAWKLGNGNIGFSTTFIIPTGEYDQNEQVNIGKNYFTWNPQLFYQRYLGDNWGDFSMHAAYEYNWANPKGLRTFSNPNGEKYKSGQILHMEMAFAKYLGNWRVATSVIGGYQLTNDKIEGDDFANNFLRDQLDGNRYRKVSLGLSAQYRIGGIAPINLTYNKDIYARNTAEGDSVVLRIIYPLHMF